MSARAYECPLCGTDFTGTACHSSCPMSHGCTMVRCPHCGYEFVESGKFTDMLLRWIRRGPPQVAPIADSIVPITRLPVGASAAVAFIKPTSAARVSRLASYGIVPGSEVRLVATRPTVVVSCGTSSVALETEVGQEIYVKA
ncbi:MAG TPA: FeoA family protein [Thermoanaerobaculia bacterium]|nr:FeoA family protein [Thermoanaerobaculia bacterium]